MKIQGEIDKLSFEYNTKVISISSFHRIIHFLTKDMSTEILFHSNIQNTWIMSAPFKFLGESKLKEIDQVSKYYLPLNYKILFFFKM